LLGPFEEEEMGIGTASDREVIKVEGEDLAISGSVRGERVRR